MHLSNDTNIFQLRQITANGFLRNLELFRQFNHGHPPVHIYLGAYRLKAFIGFHGISFQAGLTQLGFNKLDTTIVRREHTNDGDHLVWRSKVFVRAKHVAFAVNVN